MFRVSARTLFQLGAELISSDGIAFYELIKNSFDANSPRVDIDIDICLPHSVYVEHLEEALTKRDGRAAEGASGRLSEVRETLADSIDPSSPSSKRVRTSFAAARSWSELVDALDGANSIEFTDYGSGMTLGELDEIYLTIGTRNREIQRKERRSSRDANRDAPARAILGEKGIGRLSVMRLGWRLHVRTSTLGEPNWNLLDIDWRRFVSDDVKLIQEVSVFPKKGPPKDEREVSGTLIRVTGLRSNWTEGKAKAIANDEFSRLTDPFARSKRYPLSIRFNDRSVVIKPFQKLIFEHAHAHVHADFTVGGPGPRFSGKLDYRLRGRVKSFSLEEPELVSITSASPKLLKSLGPFSVTFYWYNRRFLEAIEGIGDIPHVRELLNRWSGGLMLFRDGFRVLPYGGPDDDWLNLDGTALRSSGFKVNRIQVVGKVDISSESNPELTDQTNREGLRDSEQKHIFILLLQHLFSSEFRPFLDLVEKELQAAMPVTLDELSDRVESEQKMLKRNLETLKKRVPEVTAQGDLLACFEESMQRINGLMKEAQGIADSFERGRAQVINLAGLGLMVEILAHELNRATEDALKSIAEATEGGLDTQTRSLLSILQSQLGTLQKRLSVLDPLSTSRRQSKESFDLISWVGEILRSHEAQFKRHGIECSVSVEPNRPKGGMPVRMVKGMVVQVLENLLSNSVYWLKQEKSLRPRFKPRIDVVVNVKTKEIAVTDNGPGVAPSRREEIFQPFVTTKPPGEGKGLGLYISREIAGYNDATLDLSEKSTVKTGRLHTFVLALGVKK